MDVLLLKSSSLFHTWPKEGALMVRYRNVAINNKGRHLPRKKNHSLVLGPRKIASKVEFEHLGKGILHVRSYVFFLLNKRNK